MAKKSASNSPITLTFRDLVLGADAETIRQALEARVRIDELIAERQAAYERIAALETQIEEVIGEPGVFPFPAPPLPVAGLETKTELFRAGSLAPASAVAPAKKSPGRPPAARPPEPDDDDESDDDPEADAKAEADDGDDDNDTAAT